MAIDIFVASDLEKPTEIDFLRRLVGHLEQRSEWAIILANIYAGGQRREVDFVIALPTSASVIEHKSYTVAVYGADNGDWVIVAKDGSRKKGEELLPPSTRREVRRQR